MSSLELFLDACKNGVLDEVRRLSPLVNVHANNEEAFRTACKYGRLDVATFLFSNYNVNFDVSAIFDAYTGASIYNHLHVVQWLDCGVGVTYRMCAFQVAICHGNLDIAKWLFTSRGVLNYHWNDDRAFRAACVFGHLHVAKWLVGMGGVDVHAKNEEAFRDACENGRLDIAMWIVDVATTPVDIHAYGDYAFQHACGMGHLNVAKWLVSLDGLIDIHAHDDYAFRLTSNLELGRWLIDRDPEYAWDKDVVDRLCGWSDLRGGWIWAVVFAANFRYS